VCERESRGKGERERDRDREREEERKREREGAREMNHLRDNIISFALHKLKISSFLIVPKIFYTLADYQLRLIN